MPRPCPLVIWGIIVGILLSIGVTFMSITLAMYASTTRIEHDQIEYVTREAVR